MKKKMNSKECLKLLFNNVLCESCTAFEKCYKSKKKDLCGDWKQTIEQDLDLLKQLEKENQELKEEVDELEKTLEKIKELPRCDICDANWLKGCLCLQKKIKRVFESVGNNNVED